MKDVLHFADYLQRTESFLLRKQTILPLGSYQRKQPFETYILYYFGGSEKKKHSTFAFLSRGNPWKITFRIILGAAKQNWKIRRNLKKQPLESQKATFGKQHFSIF